MNVEPGSGALSLSSTIDEVFLPPMSGSEDEEGTSPEQRVSCAKENADIGGANLTTCSTRGQEMVTSSLT